jgi:hypothetical protein
MLKTNGSAASMTPYSDDAGALVVLTGRQPADRVPLGYAKFSIRYRFAGIHRPGVTDKKPSRP